MNDNDRYSRQRDIVPHDRLAACRATVIGLGAIGRQVALQLAAMGISWLQLVDFDLVEPSNLSSQGFLEDDLGRLKVDAVADLCQQINHHLEVHAMPQRFRRSMAVGSVLFCCVDHIETRRQVWEAVQHKIDFFCDGRMAAEVLRVVTISDSASRDRYPETLFAANEAFAGSCTAKSTIYCANVAAGLMLSQLAKWLRHLIVDFDCQLNLLSNELTVAEAISQADSQSLKGNQNHARPSVCQSDQPVPVV
jgi:sulfur carrier protein ThiS adenylyltransferase